MQSQSLIKCIGPWDLISHGPYVVRGESDHGVHVVVKSAEVWAIDRVPLCAIPVRSERVCSAVPILTDGPHVIGSDSVYGEKGGFYGGVGGGYDSPLNAVPVHGQGCVITADPVVANRPDVTRANGGDAMQGVARAGQARAGNLCPGRAVPVSRERLGCSVVAALLSDDPNVVGADSHCSPNARVRHGQLSHDVPLHSVPMHPVRRRPETIADCPDIVGRHRCYPVQTSNSWAGNISPIQATGGGGSRCWRYACRRRGQRRANYIAGKRVA
jgi:hypothetical protein